MEPLIKVIRYDSAIDDLGELTLNAVRAYEQNQAFFNKRIPTVGYRFLYSRVEMDEFCNQNTEEWVVGTARDGTVAIFSSNVFGQVSHHPKSDFYPVLVHETAHLFVNNLFGFEYPVWLNEGISGYVAQQMGNEEWLIKYGRGFSHLHDYNGWGENKCDYPQAYSFTRYLIDTFGKESFFEFVSSLREKDSFSLVSNKMKQCFRASLEECEVSWRDMLKNKFQP